MNIKPVYRHALLLFCPFWLIAVLCQQAAAQIDISTFGYPQNHLPWYTIESDHFMVHYQEGNSQSAQLSSKIAEEIYGSVTSLYSHEPGRKVSIILRDREDYSNGAAFFFDDKIEIWVPALDTPFRGTHHWLRNVITHEFTHIVQLGAAMRRTQKIPAVYLQWLSYEDIRRPDVLYGFPDGIITFPFATVSIPAWFAEGAAQYQRSGLTFDYWDSHRDMLLRTRILSNTALNLSEMGFFTSKNSLERELIYNQGFDFIIYLVEEFGEHIIAELTTNSAKSGQNNFENVLESVTDIPAKILYQNWFESRKKLYNEQISSLHLHDVTRIEENGFLNFYPQFSNNGHTFAYLTNRGRDVARTSLIIQKNDTELAIENTGGPALLDSEQHYQASHGFNSNSALDFISNRFSFSHDDTKIVYSKAAENRYGETYQDIYIFDLNSEKSRKITESARIQDPAWHPSENKLVAVQQKGGTQNLVIIDINTQAINKITDFNSGETIHTPVWKDEHSIYFAMALEGNRDLFKFNTNNNKLDPVLSNPLVDFRDPWVDSQSGHLYFASDISGIFNIYRKSFSGHSIQQLTELTGGAFMPHVKYDSLYFSEYRADGYKISFSSIPEQIKDVSDQYDWNAYLNSSDYQHENARLTHHLLTEQELLDLPSVSEDSDDFTFILNGEERSWRPYSETTTGLSVYPVIRFDNYTKLNGSNSRLLRGGQLGNLGQNLWRDLKAGAYFSSRDVTETFSIFGGAMLGLGSLSSDGLADFFSPSRINTLDRDLFLIVDYRGLPFIKRSWSPTISVEIYNLKRNVRDGISIEEFPCTSCLPVDKSIDIRYNMWEANLFLRSKLNRWSLLELGASYSPYSVTTDNFFSEEFGELVPGSTSEYFRGTTYSATYYTDLTLPSRHSDIAPKGIKSSLGYKFEPGRLLQEFEISDGSLSPVFSRDYNHSIEFRNRLGFAITENTNGMLTTRAFAYLNRPEDYFYQDYAGGLGGMRSYPYFALGGQRTWFTRASLLRPIFTEINRQAGPYSFDKMYAHLFFEVGNGWGGPLEIGSNIKTGLGGELRFALNTYYIFPMKFFVNATYGFNQLNVTLPSQFISTGDESRVQYGREFLFYFGLTFDFDLL